MKNQTRILASLIAGACLFFTLDYPAKTQTPRSQSAKAAQKENPLTKRASGTFEVKLTPQTEGEKVGDPSVGRMSINKLFSGGLEGTSKGQMLAVSTEVEGSAGYVAMERVTGTLDGHSGCTAT
jgi:hypothetical protein